MSIVKMNGNWQHWVIIAILAITGFLGKQLWAISESVAIINAQQLEQERRLVIIELKENGNCKIPQREFSR